MGKLANAAFYLLTFLAFASTLVVLLSKQAKFYTYGAIAAFISIGGLYLFLKSPVMFIFQILFFIMGLGALLIYLGADVNNEEKLLLNLNIKTLAAPLVLAGFAFLVSPFLIHQINSHKISLLTNTGFAHGVIDVFDINLLIISLIAIAALGGFYTIAFWRKK